MVGKYSLTDFNLTCFEKANAVADQGFSRWGIYSACFSQKLHENEESVHKHSKYLVIASGKPAMSIIKRECRRFSMFKSRSGIHFSQSKKFSAVRH